MIGRQPGAMISLWALRARNRIRGPSSCERIPRCLRTDLRPRLRACSTRAVDRPAAMHSVVLLERPAARRPRAAAGIQSRPTTREIGATGRTRHDNWHKIVEIVFSRR